jgi:hypothetical protein
MAELITLGGLLVGATVWLTARIERIPAEMMRMIREHERDCMNFDPSQNTNPGIRHDRDILR